MSANFQAFPATFPAPLAAFFPAFSTAAISFFSEAFLAIRQVPSVIIYMVALCRKDTLEALKLIQYRTDAWVGTG